MKDFRYFFLKDAALFKTAIDTPRVSLKSYQQRLSLKGSKIGKNWSFCLLIDSADQRPNDDLSFASSLAALSD